MTDINSNINLNIDTNEAIQSIKNLQRQISVFHQQMLRSGSAANEQISRNLQSNLMKNIDATGKFRTQIKTIQSETESFTQALEKNQMSIGQYFRYAGGATKSFGKMFSKEFNTIEKVAIERVKTLQTQYIKLGRDANGALKSIAVRPLALDMDNLATKTAIAAQKQQLLNQLLKQGSTNLLNFGKNTQWAGRQLMVGFTIPLGIAATTAAKAYMDIEKASIKFRRVYGDLNTGAEEATRMSEEVKQLAMEFTKYGVAVKDTMEMAATAAATGSSGAALLAQIQQASKLAVLGQVEQQQALETTISLTNAFQIATEDLAGSINFLNAVENQTVTSIEDLTIAIPKAAPVIQQLGGDVKDLSFFLTAMKEGGINASEGANALKSGLASLINPTAKASEFLQGFGVNINGIVEANKGDVKGLVVDFAQALDTLDPLNRARAIEQLFGKFQFARLSTLFQNVIAEGSQAQTVLNLAKATSEELAVLSERELKKVEDSPVFKFQKAIEQIQAKLAPVGEAFLKAITPIVEQVGKILDGFNNMGDGAKQFAVIATTVIAGIGPIALMTFGLIANGVANLIKMFASIKNFFNKTGSSTADLGETTEYMTQAQLEAQAVAAALDETHAKLVQSFTLEAEAINKLVAEYEKAIAAQSRYNAGAKPTEGGTPGTTQSAAPTPGGTPTEPGSATTKPKPTKPVGMPVGGPTVSVDGRSVPLGEGVKQASAQQMQTILDGIASGAIKIENSEEVLSVAADKLAQLTTEGNVTLAKFYQAVGVAAEDVTGKSIGNQVNTFAQKELGLSGRPMRYSANGVGTIPQQMEASGRQDELARAQQRLQAEAGLGLSGQVQLDRAHRVAVTNAEKMFPQAWQPDAFNVQTHSENAVSNALAGDNAVKGFKDIYTEKLQRLMDEGTVSAETFKSIMDKINGNLALSESELAIQADVLKLVTQENQEFLAKSTALNNDVQRTIAGASVPGALLPGAGEIMPQTAQAIRTDINKATGRPADFKPEELIADAKKVGNDTGQGVIDGAKETLDTNSPSRKMYDIGKDGAQGLINGARDGFLTPPPGSGIVPPGSQAKGVLPPPPMTSIPGVTAPTYTAPQKGKMAGLFDKAKGMAGQAASKVGDVAKKAGSNLYQAADKAFGEHMAAVMEEEDRAREIRQAQFSNLLEEARLNDAEFAAAADKRDQLIKLAQSGTKLSAEQQAELEQAYKVIDKKKKLLSAEIDAGNMQEAANNVSEGGGRTPYRQLNKAGRKQAFKDVGNKVGKGAMGLSAVAGVASMIPGPVGEAASSLMPMLGSLSMLSGLITGPVSAAFVGLAAVIAVTVGVALKLNEAYSQARDKAMAMTEATGASTKAIRGLAEFAGKVSSGEFMDKVRKDRQKITYSAPGKTTFGESFVQSEAGKALLEQYKTLMKTGGAKEVARDMSSQLSTAIITGALSANQAKSIAANLAYELGNATIGLKVRAEIVEILGPNGDKFEKNPVEVTAKVTEKSLKNLEDSMTARTANINSNIFTNTGAGRAVTVTGAVAGGTAIGAAIGAAVSGPFAPIGALIGGIVGGSAAGIGAFFAMKDAAETAGKLSGIAVADMSTMIQQQNELSDALDAYYIKKIREAEAEGKITEAKRLQLEYDTKKNEQNKAIADGTQKMLDLLNQAADKGAFVEGTQSALDTKFKDDPNAQLYMQPIKSMMDTVGLNEEQKVLLNISMISDSMAPGEVSALLSLIQKDSTFKEITFDILTRFPGKTGAEALGIAQMIDDETLKKDFILSIQKAKTASEVDDLTKLALDIQSLGGVVEQSVDTMLSYAIKNKSAAKEIDRVRTELEAQEVTTLEQAYEIIPQIEMNENLFDKEYFKTLKNIQEKELYLQTITVGLQTVDNVKTDPSFWKWFNEGGGGRDTFGSYESHDPTFWRDVYVQHIAEKVTQTAVDATAAVDAGTPAGGGGAKETSFLDAIVKRIRDVLSWTQKLTEGWAKSKKAIEDFAKTGMNVFDGLEMKLKRAGATDELTGAILGLSKEDYDKYRSRLIDAKGNLTDFARTLIKVTNQLAFGDAIVQNDKIVLQAKTMSQAFSGANNGMQKLIKSGLISAADAYEILSDATLASAFAADKEGKSRKALVNSYMMAKKAQWLMLSADQKRQKYIEMYNANLEVIAIEEEKINKKYDERNEALDKIQAANDAIAKQNQAQLSLTEAFAKGDLSGAVRAAKEMESLAASQAIEARRAAMEQARKDELSKVEVDINGVLMTRQDIEEKIKLANEATVLAKAAQLNEEVKIGKQAEANRQAVINWSASKDNPASKNYVGNTGLGGQQGKVDPVDPVDPTVTPKTDIKSTVKAVADEKSIAGGSALAGKLRYLSAGPGGFAAKTAKGKAEEKKNQALQALNIFKTGLPEERNRTKAQKTKLGELQKAYDTAKAEVATFTEEGFAKQVSDVLMTLPGDIQAAFTQLKANYDSTERTALVAAEKEAKTVYDSTIKRVNPDPKERTDAETKSIAKKLKTLMDARRALKAYDTQNITPLRGALTAKGYGFGIKAFTGYAKGGMVMPQYFAVGGQAMGTDTVPAMLTPGEFIVSQPAVEDFGINNLKAINNGTYGGNSVYNYSVNVNAGSNASADDIARAVMNKINEVDARRVRGNNF
jgi:TP901 family phage tail tape measure protein